MLPGPHHPCALAAFLFCARRLYWKGNTAVIPAPQGRAFPRSAVQFHSQRAVIAHAACCDCLCSVLHVFRLHREDSYQGAGMNDEGCWEICSSLLHPLHDALQAGLKCFAFRSQRRLDDACSRFFLAVYGLCLCFTRDWLMPGCRMQSVRDGLDGCLHE